MTKLKRIRLDFLKVDGKKIDKISGREAIDILNNKTKPNTLYQVQIYQDVHPHAGPVFQYKNKKLCYEVCSNPDFNLANHPVPFTRITTESRWKYTIKVPIFEEVLEGKFELVKRRNK